MKLFDFFKRSDKRTAKRKIGDRGEALAVEYLKKNGYIILERNWRYKKGEIDIIALLGGTVAFVEVKTTSSQSAESFKLPIEAVDRQKRISITNAAREFSIRWRRRYPFDGDLFRFDIIEVYLDREKPEIIHIKDAFYAEKGNRNKWKT